MFCLLLPLQVCSQSLAPDDTAMESCSSDAPRDFQSRHVYRSPKLLCEIHAALYCKRLAVRRTTGSFDEKVGARQLCALQIQEQAGLSRPQKDPDNGTPQYEHMTTLGKLGDYEEVWVWVYMMLAKASFCRTTLLRAGTKWTR